VNDNQIEGESGMASEFRNDGLKVVGTRPIRPDGIEKVTGRANFGADRTMPGMLYGKIKRSPHAHAWITKINTESALALPGVRAVVTAADFPEIPPEEAFVGEGPMNFRDLSRNVMARGKALYEGHAVAAVAAVSPAIAAEALELIEVDYEVLPHVIDVEEAMAMAPRCSMRISSPKASTPNPKSHRTSPNASASRRATRQQASARPM
jgi:CO/xanthine dehydrogenase Mo-binding subunit